MVGGAALRDGCHECARSAVVADARIEKAVKDVDRQVGEGEDADHDHHQGLGHVVVVVGDRLDEQLADTVEVEHLLGDDEAAHQERELDADDGDDRQQRVAQRVPAHDQLVKQSLGAGRAHIVLAQHLEHGRAGHARGHRGIAIAGGERRPDQHAQVVDRIDPDRHVGDGRHPGCAEQCLGRVQDAEDDQDAEPERGHGDAGDRERPDDIVDPGVLLDGGDGAERNREQQSPSALP